MRTVEVFRDLVPDTAVIGIVLDSDEHQLYDVQMVGRQQTMRCRSVAGYHTPGECVIVLLEPHETIPTILGASPWRTIEIADPLTIHWADIEDRLQATALVPDVAANYLAAHQRQHSLLSSQDHDAGGLAQEGDVLTRSGGRWTGAPAPAAAGSASGLSRRFNNFMMMGC